MFASANQPRNKAPEGPIHLPAALEVPWFLLLSDESCLPSGTCSPPGHGSGKHRCKVLQLPPSGTSSCKQNFVRARVLHKTFSAELRPCRSLQLVSQKVNENSGLLTLDLASSKTVPVSRAAAASLGLAGSCTSVEKISPGRV